MFLTVKDFDGQLFKYRWPQHLRGLVLSRTFPYQKSWVYLL